MNNTTWPCEWYANGEYQTEVVIRLTDKQIQAITALITEWSVQNEDNN